MTEKKSQEDIEHVANMANAHAFICQFQHGYETECGERGVQIAGGQKRSYSFILSEEILFDYLERIALARALVRSPKILLLDEATSALDAEAESQVQEAISRTVIGRTVLIIAHRLSTIRHADRILVLQYGTIVEEGTHMELMDKRGLYYQLVKRQTEQIEMKQSRNTPIEIPLMNKQYSTTFNPRESI